MSASATVDGLFAAMVARGGNSYGLSGVSQLDHALQTAALAEAQGLAAAMIIAALFHDIGHLRTRDDVELAEIGIDDRHEETGARLLAAVFGPAVSEPVRLHVIAKRYLVATEPAYAARLSAESRRSLALQGGPLIGDARAAMTAEPFFANALTLRRLDDAAKVPGHAVAALDSYRPLAERLGRER